MVIKKYYCDCCGKEVETEKELKMIGMRFKSPKIIDGGVCFYESIDICKKCKPLFNKYITEEDEFEKIKAEHTKPPRVNYDHVKNIKHLILRYNNKQDTLHVSTSEYDEGLNDGLLTAIHDLEYILKEMEV